MIRLLSGVFTPFSLCPATRKRRIPLLQELSNPAHHHLGQGISHHPCEVLEITFSALPMRLALLSVQRRVNADDILDGRHAETSALSPKEAPSQREFGELGGEVLAVAAPRKKRRHFRHSLHASLYLRCGNLVRRAPEELEHGLLRNDALETGAHHRRGRGSLNSERLAEGRGEVHEQRPPEALVPRLHRLVDRIGQLPVFFVAEAGEVARVEDTRDVRHAVQRIRLD